MSLFVSCFLERFEMAKHVPMEDFVRAFVKDKGTTYDSVATTLGMDLDTVKNRVYKYVSMGIKIPLRYVDRKKIDVKLANDILSGKVK